MLVKIYVSRRPSGRYRVLPLNLPNSTLYWVKWRTVTVGLWREVIQGPRLSPSDREWKMWKVLLAEASFLQDLKETHEENQLTEEALDRVRKLTPGLIGHLLLRPIYTEIDLPKEDLDKIKQDSFNLWTGTQGIVNDPHPVIEEVVTAEKLYQKLGVPMFPNVENLLQRKYRAIQEVMKYRDEAEVMKEAGDRLTREAVQAARGY